MKNKLLLNFFSSGLQAVAVQIFGVAFFYVLSLYFSKNDFGIISWANFVSSFATVILGFGLEQSVVRRIVLSKTSDWAASVYIFHAFVTSVVTLFILLIISFFSGQDVAMSILPWVFIAQAFLYIATPLKQYLNAKERFTPYGAISFISNLAKIALALILIRWGTFALLQAVYILIATSLFALLALLLYVKVRLHFHFIFRWKAYKGLLKESFPLYFASLFDNSIACMGVILVGIISTKISTADYGFAYRAYEVTKLPLVIIAPVILPKFVRLLSGNTFTDERKDELRKYFAIGVFISLWMFLCLNIVWKPWVGVITHYKYGASNAIMFLFLSLSLPFHFFITLLYTLVYAGGKYRVISSTTLITAVINLVLNVVLIPIYGGLGAAFAFWVATVLQAILYYAAVKRHFMSFNFLTPVFILLIALGSYALAYYVSDNTILRLLITSGIYIALVLLTRQINRTHLAAIRLVFKR